MEHVMSVELSTLVAQMSDEELERASKELVLDVAHWREKDRKKYAQLVVWQSFVVDEMWRRHCGFTQVIIRKWWTWKELKSWEVVESRREDSYFVSNSVYNSP